MTILNDKNKDNYDYIINTKDGTYRKQKVKTYKYCWKCARDLPEGSVMPFCDSGCMNEFYAENAKEINAVWREIRGID